MRDSVRWRKQARIVLMLAEELGLSEEEALDLFYNSRTYPFFADATRGLQALSDRYIVDEVLRERAGDGNDQDKSGTASG